MYSTDTISQLLTTTQPRKKESEIRKERIAENRQQIAALKAKIGELASQHGPLVNRIVIDRQIETLRAGIKNLEVGIANLENGLPQLIAVEEATERIGAEMEQQARAKEAADRQAHEAAVKGVALAQWLEVPGQTEQGFEAEWPTIARQIAMQAAVAAGAVEATAKHRANPVAQYAQDILKGKYGNGAGVSVDPS